MCLRSIRNLGNWPCERRLQMLVYMRGCTSKLFRSRKLREGVRKVICSLLRAVSSERPNENRRNSVAQLSNVVPSNTGQGCMRKVSNRWKNWSANTDKQCCRKLPKRSRTWHSSLRSTPSHDSSENEMIKHQRTIWSHEAKWQKRSWNENEVRWCSVNWSHATSNPRSTNEAIKWHSRGKTKAIWSLMNIVMWVSIGHDM